MKKFIFISALFTFFFSLSTFNCAAQTPDWAWAKCPTTWLSYWGDWGRSIVTDAKGNIYITGSYDQPNLVFGTDTLTNSGGSVPHPDDLFLVKYDTHGNVIWAKSAGGKDDDLAYSVAIDTSGNIYIAGGFSSPIFPFGTDTLKCKSSGYYDIFLIKFDTSGNALWARSAGGTTDDVAYSVAVDASGNAYLAGFFESDTITFGSDTIINTGGTDIFLAKYDSSGNLKWVRTAGNTNIDYANSVAADASGNSYITGYFGDSLFTLGSDTLINVNPYHADIFLAKYDTYGNVIWAKSAGGSLDEQANSVAVDKSGNVYIAGYFISPTLSFDSIVTLTAGLTYNAFLAKYNTYGNVLWAKCVGHDYSEAQSVTLDTAGNPYIAGPYGDTITFGSITLLCTPGVENVFVAKYDSIGNVFWAKSAGGYTAGCFVPGIAVDSGNIYITGAMRSDTLIFGSSVITPSPSNEFTTFIAKLYYNKIIEGINKQDNSLNLTVYPSPATNTLTIDNPQAAVGRKQEAIIEITNIQGQLIKTITTTGNKTNIDVSALPSGVYVVEVRTEKGVSVKKFIKE